MTTISDKSLLPQPNLIMRIAVIVVLALCVAAAYIPILGAGWVFDDVNLVKPSPALENLSGLGRAVSTDLYRQAAPRLEASPYWRPLAMASFWLDTRFIAPPFALHLGNLILHALVTALLVFVIMRRHGGIAGVIAAAVSALWWALHPENVEVVAWISCRYDLLCCVALLCLLAIPWRPGPFRAVLQGLVFLAGLLSKEGFGAIAAVVVAMDIADQRPVRDAAPRWAAIALAIIIWMILRAVIGIKNFDMPSPEAFLSILLAYPEAIAIYFWRTLTVPPLTISHPYAPGNVLIVLAGIVIIAAFIGITVKWRRFTVPVVIFLAGFLPVTGAMVLFREAPERYLYIPMTGLAMLLGELVVLAISARSRLVRVVVPAAVLVVTIMGLVQLEQRLPDWKNDDTLWEAALRVDPLDPQANFNIAISAGRRKDWDTAYRSIEIAAKGDPDSGRIASTYAWVLLQINDIEGSIREAERATTLAPYQPDGWYYLAFARHRSGDHAGELAAVEKLLQISPDYPGAQEMRTIAECELSGRTDCFDSKPL